MTMQLQNGVQSIARTNSWATNRFPGTLYLNKAILTPKFLHCSANGDFPKKKKIKIKPKPSYLIKSKYIKNIQCSLRNYPTLLHIIEKEAKHILLIICLDSILYCNISKKSYFLLKCKNNMYFTATKRVSVANWWAAAVRKLAVQHSQEG